MVGQKMDVIFNAHGLMEAEAEIACHPANAKLTAAGDPYVHRNIARVIQRARGYPPNHELPHETGQIENRYETAFVSERRAHKLTLNLRSITRKRRAKKPGKSSREASRLGDVGPVRNEPLPGLAPETRDAAMQHQSSDIADREGERVLQSLQFCHALNAWQANSRAIRLSRKRRSWCY